MGLNLSKNVVKGEKLNLVKDNGEKITQPVMGLGWDAQSTWIGSSDSIDLDASVAFFSDTNELLDTVSFQKLRSNDGSTRHSGDNRTGEGEGDDERVALDLTKVNPNVKTIVFVVNSYLGQKFNKVANCFCRLFEAKSGEEFDLRKQGEEYCRFNLAEKGDHTGKIMAKLYRHNGEWKFAALGNACNGKVIRDMLPEIVAVL